MSNLWQCLELLAGGNHVAAEWAKLSGEQFAPLRSAFLCDTQKRARFIPCPHGCGCEHEIVVRAGGKLAALCRCEPWNCDDITLTSDDVVMWQINRAKFGRAVAKAFDCDAKDADLRIPGTRQVASFGSAAMPVVLTIQHDRANFASAVVQLVATLKECFILLAPTSRFLDGNTRALLKGAKAGFFDLASNLVLLPGGNLHAPKKAGVLFSPFLPENESAVTESEAKKVFALMKSLDLGTKYRKAPLEKVFRLLVLEDRTQEYAARKCNCSEPLISLRVRQIEAKMKHPLAELKGFASRLADMSAPVEDSRARNIYRKGLTDDTGDD